MSYMDIDKTIFYPNKFKKGFIVPIKLKNILLVAGVTTLFLTILSFFFVFGWFVALLARGV